MGKGGRRHVEKLQRVKFLLKTAVFPRSSVTSKFMR
jgi:hypothetical protein